LHGATFAISENKLSEICKPIKLKTTHSKIEHFLNKFCMINCIEGFSKITEYCYGKFIFVFSLRNFVKEMDKWVKCRVTFSETKLFFA